MSYIKRIFVFLFFAYSCHAGEYSNDIPCELNNSPKQNQQPKISSTTITYESNRSISLDERQMLNGYVQKLSSMPAISRKLNEIKKGQKFYTRYLKPYFNGLNGTKFAIEHTAAEWEELFSHNAEKFIKIYGERFPNSLPILTNSILPPNVKTGF